jgi:broad specificity phosphatase PhoE
MRLALVMPATASSRRTPSLDRATALIRDLEREHSGQVILLVSHGDTLQIMQAGFARMDAGEHRRLAHLATAEVRRLDLAIAPGRLPD